MAITLLQSTKKVVNGVANTTLAYGSNLTAGSLLAMTQSQWVGAGVGISTPTDTLTQTWVPMTAEQGPANPSGRLRSYYVQNSAAGANTVTGDIAGADTGDITLVIAEFSDVATSGALDQTQVGTGTTATAVTSGATATTAQADELIWGGMMWDGGTTTLAETGSATIVQENEAADSSAPIGASYRVVSATGAYTATWTLGAAQTGWAAHVATFKAVAGVIVAPIFPFAITQRMG